MAGSWWKHESRTVTPRVSHPARPASKLASPCSSSLKAIKKAEAAGLKVTGVISVVDRLAGAAEIFAENGYPLRSLLTIRDFGIEPE